MLLEEVSDIRKYFISMTNRQTGLGWALRVPLALGAEVMAGGAGSPLPNQRLANVSEARTGSLEHHSKLLFRKVRRLKPYFVASLAAKSFIQICIYQPHVFI